MKKVSVIIPIYNMRNSIKNSVKAILRQTYSNLEIILVDDGSKDDSYSLCQELVKDNDKIKVWHTENRGSGHARNFGIEKASGDYVYFPDADDVLQEDAIEILVNVMESKFCDLVVFGFRSIDYKGKLREKKCPAGDFAGEAIRQNYDVYYSNYNIQGAPWNKFFDLHKIKDKGIRYPSLRRHQDEVFISRYVTHVEKVCFIDETLYTYYTNSLEREWKKYPLDYIEIVTKLKEYQMETIASWNANNDLMLDIINNSYISNFIKALELSFSKKFNFNKTDRYNWIVDKVSRPEFLETVKIASLQGLNYQRKIVHYIKCEDYHKLYNTLHFKVFIDLRFNWLETLIKHWFR